MRLLFALGVVCAVLPLISCDKPRRRVATLGTIAAAERLVVASLSHGPPSDPEERALEQDKPAAEAEAKPGKDGAVAPPAGYVPMRPKAHSSPAIGNAVLLFDEHDEMVVPIFIGGTEALSIQLRLERKRFKRPLTHDLMDEALRRLDAELLYVRVDELKGNVFIGSVVMIREDKRFVLDARPSDAIALAIGNEVPIFVSKKLIHRTGIRTDDLRSFKPDKGSEPMAL